MATLLRADGTSEKLDLPPDQGLTLPELQALVGGFIEVVSLDVYRDRCTVLIIDEEGKLRGKPLNRQATVLWRLHAPHGDDVIVGDAVLAVIVRPGQDDEQVR